MYIHDLRLAIWKIKKCLCWFSLVCRGITPCYEVHVTYVKNMELITIRNAKQA